ncbi:MAG: TetR/AcrR family transcriptional regulator [Coriobacteriales bacterium]|nr:TetR/AcrR family transcriptional regulator [Coriobacteriales bacterium]
MATILNAVKGAVRERVGWMDTREAIRAEFMRTYAQVPLDRITVKGLCAAVPVARTTFYAHYRNVDEVLVEVEDGLLAGLAEVTERVSAGDLQRMDFLRFLDETFAFIRRNWTYFHALLIDQPDLRFIDKWKDAVKANFARRYPQARMQANWGLISEMVASATIGAYSYWMEHPDAAGMEEAKRLVERALAAMMAAL